MSNVMKGSGLLKTDTTEPAVGFSPVFDRMACPNCGTTEMHQTRYAMFCRKEDGEATVVEVDAISGATTSRPDTAGDNPSLRRQGISISLICEQCHHETALHLAQHKGATMISTDAGQPADESKFPRY